MTSILKSNYRNVETQTVTLTTTDSSTEPIEKPSKNSQTTSSLQTGRDVDDSQVKISYAVIETIIEV